MTLSIILLAFVIVWVRLKPQKWISIVITAISVIAIFALLVGLSYKLDLESITTKSYKIYDNVIEIWNDALLCYDMADPYDIIDCLTSSYSATIDENKDLINHMNTVLE